MTTPTDDLAQALREMIDYYRGDRTEEPYVMGRARAALEAHERAQPASAADDYREIARLIGCIFFYGEFRAETPNERDLEILLRRTGNFYETEDQLLAAAPQPAKESENATK